MNQVATTPEMGAAIESVLIGGDLSKLTAEQRVVHYKNVCDSLGLNYLTQPFRYMPGRDGKLGLYPGKDCTDQLRKINAISIAVIERNVVDGVLIVRVRASDQIGRQDEDFGAVAVAGLRGQAAADAYMKAVTKAKRRVTLSISGLGLPESAATSDDDGDDELEARVRNTKPLINPSATQDERSKALDQELENHKHLMETDTQERVPSDLTSQAESAGTLPHKIDRTDDSAAAWSAWGAKFMAYVRAASDDNVINEWVVANADHFDALERADRAKHTRLVEMVKHEQDKRIADDHP